MNPSFLERTNLLPKSFVLAVMIGGIIPTFTYAALAQSSQSTDPTDLNGPASAYTPARLNGSVNQSFINGTGGMRMTRGQTAGSAVTDQGSLFSNDALSSFNTGPASASVAAPAAAPIYAPPNSGSASGGINSTAGNGGNHGAGSGASAGGGTGSIDFGKALSLGTTMFNGINRLMNDNRSPISSVFNGSTQSSNTMFNRPNISNAGTSLLNGSAGQFFKIAKPLSRNEINLLSNYDVAVIIDKSGSMQTQDCPGGLSRWDFCREQLLNLTSQVSTAFRSGITVALFSSGYHIFNNVSFSMVPQIFATNSPDGGTYLGRPLKDIFANYFAQRDSNVASHTPTRPLLIEIITDGDPSDKESVIQSICEATQRMSSPKEVSVQFLQIGHEMEGSRILNELDNRLVSDDGAQYDIVNVEPFEAVLNEGLARSLVASATHQQ